VWDFDLIVVGGGPGGSNAAAVALRAGLKVAQIEAARFPRVKPCAGGVTVKALRSLQGDPGASAGPFTAIEFNLWGRRRSRFTHPGGMVQMVCRPGFDHDLVQQNLRHSNFSFLDGRRVLTLEYAGLFKVTTDRGVLTGPQLIGADGAHSIVNRIFRIASPRAVATAVEINLSGDETADTVPCLDYGAIPQGYGWVFPKRDHASAGLYTLASRTRDVRTALRAYIRSKGLRMRDESLADMKAHRLPVGGFLLRVPPCPVYIVGDAGGFADALTGEGIYHALESGRLAGEAAVDVAFGRKHHAAYYHRLWRTVLFDTAATFFAARLFYRNVERGLRVLDRPLVWRPLIAAAAAGATFGECALKSGYFLHHSFKDKATAERCDWNGTLSVPPAPGAAACTFPGSI
jgi:geranylgeranyl reductase family protein